MFDFLDLAGITIPKLLMAAILMVAILFFAKVLIRKSNSEHSQLNLEDLLLGDDGKMSKAAAVMLGAFALTSWVIVYLALQSKLTEGYFAAYLAAWVAPTVTRLIVIGKPQESQDTKPRQA